MLVPSGPATVVTRSTMPASTRISVARSDLRARVRSVKRDTEAMAMDGQSIFLTDLKDLGYIPEAVVNWIALMGWSYDDKTEIFTMQELIEKFDIDKLNPSPAAINFDKFDYFNGIHIRMLDPDDLAVRIKPFIEKAGYTTDDETLKKIAPKARVY